MQQPYRPYTSGLDLNQILQFIQLAEAQNQGQPSQGGGLGGIGSLLGGGGAGAAGASAMGGGAATTGASLAAQNAGMLAPSAPSYLSGFSAGMPAASSGASTLGLSGMGAGPAALGALGAGAFLSNIYEGGGKNIIKGKGKSKDYANMLLDSNPVTAPINMGLRALGLKSVGKGLFGGKSTGDRQNEKWGTLYKEGKVPDWFMQQGVTQDQGVDDKKLASGKLGGRDVWATSAFFNKFSKPNQTWDKTGTEAQREQVANEILKGNFLDTRKGLTRFTDENAVQGIYDRIMGSKQTSAPQGRGGANGPLKINDAPYMGTPLATVNKGSPASVDPRISNILKRIK